MPTIGLSMIVKDEAHVIARCLDRLRPLIDAAVIVDTGSSDGTQGIVRDYLARHDIAGEVVEEPWRDFAANRTSALAALRRRPEIDYALVMDADDLLAAEPGFDPARFKAELSADVYDLDIRHGGTRYQRPQLFANRLPFAYRSVLHEYLAVPPEARGRARAAGLHIVYGADGGRSRDPDKYRKDAAVLERALEAETDPFLRARYTFYLAQSWRDCGEREKAAVFYLRRAEMGFWDQEVFCALLNAGRLIEAMGREPDAALAAYARASAACPGRAEAAHAASRLCRELGRNREGFDFAAPARGLAAPPDGLFVEGWIYSYGLLDELAVNAYWAGRHADSRDACLAVLERGDLPAGERPRVLANLRFALDRLTPPDGVVWRAEGPVAPLAMPAIGAGRGGAGSVSVVTPTRGRAAFLRRAAEHVRAQTHADLEWLILDDSDEPLADLDAVAGPRVRYEHSRERLTVGEKRNRLAERARGEVVVQFDDDDYYAPGYVAAMLGEMAARRADLLNLRGWFLFDLRWGAFGYWDLMRKAGPHYRLDGAGVALTVLDEATGGLADSHFGYGFSYAYKRRVWEADPFPHVDWNEDARFAMAARGRFAVDGFHDTEGLCLHLLHAASSSRCFPQHLLPPFLMRQLFPAVGAPGAEA